MQRCEEKLKASYGSNMEREVRLQLEKVIALLLSMFEIQ